MKTWTLGEYREKVLGVKQVDIAKEAECQQAWVSQVENGHLPKPWNRDKLLKAYKLQRKPEMFEKMVQNASKLKALQKPMSETEPLFATGAARSVAEIYRGALAEAQHILALQEEQKRARA